MNAILRQLVRRARRLLGRSTTATAGWAIKPTRAIDSWCLETRFAVDRVPAAAAEAFWRRQTLPEHRVVGVWRDGRVAYRYGIDDSVPARLLHAPGDVPDETLDPAFLDLAMLTLASYAVDGVVLGTEVDLDAAIRDRFADPEWHRRLVVAADSPAYRCDGAVLRRTEAPCQLYAVDPRGAVHPDAPEAIRHRRRQGSWIADHDLGRQPALGVHDAAAWRRQAPTDGTRQAMLVTVPFLARGGAEHTLIETLHALVDRWDVTYVTLAPHRPELGDRRDEVQAVWPRLLALGDTVHPVAMPGQLASLIESTGATVWYNANSTTLFYDFVPELRARFPELFIVDHLYDHRVGYIDRYDDPALLEAIDAVVAENHRIQDTLVDRGWPIDRLPVVWPCGRRDDAFPTIDERASVRAAIRAEMGFDDDEIVILTAARMHAQKRPLDLVRLAERLSDVEVTFLVVGGGDLEAEVDRAIAAASAARIRRLPFRTDIPELIVASDVGCLVSQYEGLPVFLLECLQAGRPFLGTDVGDLGRVLRDTGAGWIVDEPGDLDALEAAVRRLLDPAERESAAARAREAGPRFGVVACAERYDRAFRRQPVSTLGAE